MKARVTKSLVVVGLLCVLRLGASAQMGHQHAVRPTFYKDVLPILQTNCQTCHRPGEVAPMSFTTYDDTRHWAVAIKAAVLARTMPPWYADPQYGHFANERRLTPQQIKTLVSWVESGATAGDPNDAPPPVKFVDGWNIGVPDRVIEMPTAFNVPAEGTIDYQYMVIPGGFTEDTWVQAAEVRPGNRSVLHHLVAFIRPPDSKWLRSVKPGEFFVPRRPTPTPEPKQDADKKQEPANKQDATKKPGPNASQLRAMTRNDELGELLIAYAPGMSVVQLTDEAKLVKAGSDIVLQLHYTAHGTPGADKTRIGVIFAKERPKLSNVMLAASNAMFRIPPYDGNYEVKAQVQLQETVLLSSFWPHMHLRGKDFVYKAIYPDGRTETLLSIPKYDFNWQNEYRLAKPLLLPKGTRIECTAHFDNSADNPRNPDPSKEVTWGDQNWEEMMIGFFSVSVDPSLKPAALMKVEKPGTRTPLGTEVEQARKH